MVLCYIGILVGYCDVIRVQRAAANKYEAPNPASNSLDSTVTAGLER
jgi:hypothetical protein